MDHQFTHRLYEQFARIGKAVSNGHRIALLHYLGQGERSVESLARLSGLSIANTSQHLQQLRQAGLVRTRKAGQHVFYQLTDDAGVLQLIDTVQMLATRQLVEVEQLLSSRLGSAAERVSTDELLQIQTRSGALVLDVRPAEEYAAGHIAGALNIPLEDLAARRHELPATKDREIVAYCRGPYSPLAHEAVRLLRRHGHRARRLEVGLPEWRLAGLPVEAAGERAAA